MPSVKDYYTALHTRHTYTQEGNRTGGTVPECASLKAGLSYHGRTNERTLTGGTEQSRILSRHTEIS